MFLEAIYLNKELTDNKIEKDMKPLLLLAICDRFRATKHLNNSIQYIFH